MVIKRLEPVVKYAPRLFEEFVFPEIEKYIERGIIKNNIGE